MLRRGELVERYFAHILDRRGMRRLRTSTKSYLTHIAGFNLGVLMRALYGQGAPREARRNTVTSDHGSQNRSRRWSSPISHCPQRIRRNVIVAADLTRN